MSPPPILYHYFKTPLPYPRTLALQEHLHQLQLTRRRALSAHKDILLLLQHRPVYTGGRRQTEDSTRDERARLTRLGADFHIANRGGILTYHGPGQIVGYPLIDLARWSPPLGIRDYICNLQTTLKRHLQDSHGIAAGHSEHTGVFLDPTTKVASIGVQVRHRLTSHGFAMNVTDEPLAWFNQIVACGLADVKAGCIQHAGGKAVSVEDIIPALVQSFGRAFGREMVEMDITQEGEDGEAIAALEAEAKAAGDWPKSPTVTSDP
ncbi:hypothetical protein HGRIS_007412 [Hohenbuehelia grisea]|uniref:Octanoyltransferase n=1 Tax=Hohenbuehelia grisea TaxID=104357 RepID=A0ABR3J5H9_9AGAR